MIIITYISALFFFLIAFVGRNPDREHMTSKEKKDEIGLYLIAAILLVLALVITF